MPCGRRQFLLCGFLFACGLSSCTPESPVAESAYSSKLVGEWRGTVERDDREVISFKADGRFTCQLQPLDSSPTLFGQGITGTIRGTWAVDGKIITLSISSAEDERVLNKATTSTIVSFKADELKVEE